jgi:hypothetical protein
VGEGSDPTLELKMALIAFVLFVVSAISVIYPLQFLMIPNRLAAFCGVLLSLAIMGATAPTSHTTKAASTEDRKPVFTSSGGCKTDINGDMKCSHSSEANLFGSTTNSTSEMKCGKNLATLAYECKSDSRSY